MKNKKFVVMSLMALSIALLIAIGISIYRIQMQKIPQEFEGVYWVQIHKKEKNQYYIQVSNSDNSPKAVVFCGNSLADLTKVGSYPLDIRRSFHFLTTNPAWTTAYMSLEVRFPYIDGILDLWIGEGRTTNFMKIRDSSCIERINPIEYLLISEGQSIHDPSHKGSIIARRSDEVYRWLPKE